MGETELSLGFGFFKAANLEWVHMPARMGYIELTTVNLNFGESRWDVVSEH